MKLLKFYADWCNPCKQLTKTLKEVEMVCPIPVESIDVDDSDNEDVVAQYGIRNIPVMLLLDDNNNLLTKMVGALPASTIISTIQSYEGQSNDKA